MSIFYLIAGVLAVLYGGIKLGYIAPVRNRLDIARNLYLKLLVRMLLVTAILVIIVINIPCGEVSNVFIDSRCGMCKRNGLACEMTEMHAIWVAMLLQFAYYWVMNAVMALYYNTLCYLDRDRVTLVGA